MVRTVIPPHHQRHEDNDAEDIATGTDTNPHRGFSQTGYLFSENWDVVMFIVVSEVKCIVKMLLKQKAKERSINLIIIGQNNPRLNSVGGVKSMKGEYLLF